MTRIILLSFFAFVATCRLENNLSEQPIARVQDRYLYTSDISQLLSDNINSADSATLVKNYIHSWAKEQLLLDKAVFNLNNAQQDELEELIRRYRNDLAVVAAILSSNKDIPINPNVCFAAEVGLAGEIRPISKIDQRIVEARKLGYKTFVASKYNKITSENPGIRLILVGKIEEVFATLFA